MSLSILLLCLNAFLVSTAWAGQKHLMIIGGGGESKSKPTTLFDNEVRNVGEFANTGKWNTRLSFNGGHSTTEAILEKTLGPLGVKNEHFTKQSYENLIKSYEDQILSGSIKSGDQLMIFINSHGSEKMAKTKTHNISTSEGEAKNLHTLEGGESVSLDRLEKLTQLASQKGIKLAILDFSCHSGNTLALSNPNTCVITSAGPNHFGYQGNEFVFTAQFTKMMKPGRSLEEVFLSARKSYPENTFPMISSPVGKEIQDLLYKALTPYLHTYTDNTGKQANEHRPEKFTKYLENELASGAYCEAPKEFEKLISIAREAESFQALSLQSLIGSPDFNEFYRALDEYYAYLHQLRQEMEGMMVHLKNKSFTFCTPHPKTKKKECMSYTLSNLMTTQYERLIPVQEREMQKLTGWKKEDAMVSLAHMKAALAKRNELLKQYPEYAKYDGYFKRLPQLQQKTHEHADKVNKATQKLYYALYHQRSLQDRRSNPCRDFKL